MKKINWANVLTWTRLVLIAPATIAAFEGQRLVVFVCFILMQTTDVLDGIVARKTGTASSAGAAFDSRVDLLSVPFLLLWLWLLFPAVIAAVTVPLIIGITAMLLVLFLVRAKIGSWSGLHLYSNKLGAILLGIVVVALLAMGEQQWTVLAINITVWFNVAAEAEAIIYLLRGGKDLDARFFWDK